MDQVRAVAKFIASFFRAEWRLEDYPLKTTFRRVPDAAHGGRALLPWTVQVINWWLMRGDGDTRERALEMLRERLSAHMAKHGTLPRPGLGAELEVEFASSDQMQQLEAIAVDFFPAILGLEYGDCLITDESSLWDFHNETSNATHERLIHAKYGVDVSDVKSGNLVEILRRIRRGDGRASGEHTGGEPP